MRLSAPSTVVFIIAVVLAVIALLAFLGTLTAIPIAAFWIMTIAFIVLAGGCLLKGI